MTEEYRRRVAEITNGLRAIQSGWPFLLVETEKLIAAHTRSLITQNNDETRGRIKALMALQDLPQALDQERQGFIEAITSQEAAESGLPEQSDPRES